MHPTIRPYQAIQFKRLRGVPHRGCGGREACSSCRPAPTASWEESSLRPLGARGVAPNCRLVRLCAGQRTATPPAVNTCLEARGAGGRAPSRRLSQVRPSHYPSATVPQPARNNDTIPSLPTSQDLLFTLGISYISSHGDCFSLPRIQPLFW